jgi:hypothetical protein
VSEEHKAYEMVGGSLDGQVMRIGGSLYPGMEWPGKSIPGRKREIYILKHDGKFHFERYGLEANPKLMQLDLTGELSPIQEKLASVLAELDALLEKYGGADNSTYTIGNWSIRHKDA